MMVKMGIKGIKIETLNKLVGAGLITRLGDCFRLVDTQVAAVPGLGLSSAEILCSALEKKLADGLWDWEILASVGILNVGRTLSKEALKVWSLDELVACVTIPDTPAAPSEIACREALVLALGAERGPMVLEGVRNHIDDIQDLISLGEFKSTKSAIASISADTPKYKVVVTGDLNHWDRDVFKDYIETLGHKMVGSISGKTDYLITNTPNSGTVKNKKAQDLGVPIITEEEAIRILGLTVPSGRAVQAATGGVKTTADFQQVDLYDL